jgi:hypothetical protein
VLLINTSKDVNEHPAFKHELDPGAKDTMIEDDCDAGFAIAMTDVGAVAGEAVMKDAGAL